MEDEPQHLRTHNCSGRVQLSAGQRRALRERLGRETELQVQQELVETPSPVAPSGLARCALGGLPPNRGAGLLPKRAVAVDLHQHVLRHAFHRSKIVSEALHEHPSESTEELVSAKKRYDPVEVKRLDLYPKQASLHGPQVAPGAGHPQEILHRLGSNGCQLAAGDERLEEVQEDALAASFAKPIINASEQEVWPPQQAAVLHAYPGKHLIVRVGKAVPRASVTLLLLGSIADTEIQINEQQLLGLFLGSRVPPLSVHVQLNQFPVLLGPRPFLRIAGMRGFDSRVGPFACGGPTKPRLPLLQLSLDSRHDHVIEVVETEAERAQPLARVHKRVDALLYRLQLCNAQLLGAQQKHPHLAAPKGAAEAPRICLRLQPCKAHVHRQALKPNVLELAATVGVVDAHELIIIKIKEHPRLEPLKSYDWGSGK
eukprot:scaffold2036_cov256-Pinguiococcus_pyrenoidosus.AAC.10